MLDKTLPPQLSVLEHTLRSLRKPRPDSHWNCEPLTRHPTLEESPGVSDFTAQRATPITLQAANERRGLQMPRPFWISRPLIGPDMPCLPAPWAGGVNGVAAIPPPQQFPLPVLCRLCHSHCPPGGDPGIWIPPRQASTSSAHDGQAQLTVHPNRRREKSTRQGHVSSGYEWLPQLCWDPLLYTGSLRGFLRVSPQVELRRGCDVCSHRGGCLGKWGQ